MKFDFLHEFKGTVSIRVHFEILRQWERCLSEANLSVNRMLYIAVQIPKKTEFLKVVILILQDEKY